jgi:hypothetical protein
MLYHLIYISSSKEPFTEDNFVKLLLRSRNNNAVNQITGILLYTQGNFIQYIEGPEQNIQSLYSKIKKDDRHYNVETVSEGEISRRSFQGWSMEYKMFPKGELEQMVSCHNIAQDKDAVKRTIKLVKLFSPPPADSGRSIMARKIELPASGHVDNNARAN